ncbi:MAG: hypothetical protein NTX53_21635 [candidate division WOR-3 bacterium]|nr:hypothetical protein [candidate division WOR-3 bacterium]
MTSVDRRPGLNPRRMLSLVEATIKRCQLNLSDTVVLTEAATGAYVVTPVIAALAGAKQVYALTRDTSYGTIDDVRQETMALAELAGVAGRCELCTEKTEDMLAAADVVTNSGHLRPIDRNSVKRMKAGSVIPFMYESWEFRAGDVDLAACREKGIQVAGTNEQHPAVDVFSYLGEMAGRLLQDAGVAVHGANVALLCDNAFAEPIERGLRAAGATATTSAAVLPLLGTERCDALLVALTPVPSSAISAADAAQFLSRFPEAVVVRFYGDLDIAMFRRLGLPLWPDRAVPPGHMGILPSVIGPEPIVRLQTGGLKVSQVLLIPEGRRTAEDRAFIQPMTV